MKNPLYFIVFTLILGLTSQNFALAQTYDNRWYRSGDFQEQTSSLPAEAETAVIIPILFGVTLKNISPNFGDPRSGGRSHDGEDIMGVKGTPIISPTAAVVLRTGYGDSAGNYVYTINPGGETFVYMHLDRIGEGVAPGVILSKGSLVGYVGNTGNASGGAAHLHFEIHNSSGNPTDPYPRLTAELSLQEKMTYLTAILSQTTDSRLASFLVQNFKSTFNSALNLGIALPTAISSLLGPNTAVAGLSVGVDLEVGSTGAAVVALQKYLIQANSGSAALKLRTAGATGTFGPVTKAALAEFQLVKGITPASGYYGSVTRSYVASHQLGVSVTEVPELENPQKDSMVRTNFDLDLRFGMNNADVKRLQVFLNANGFKIAASGAGSPGKETTYFGGATQTAVKKFQTANGIKPVNGTVGPLTRAALNSP